MATQFNYSKEAQTNNRSDITTYGALILPFDLDLANEQAEPQIDPKDVTKQQGAIISAIENENQTSELQQAIAEATDPEEQTALQDKLNAWQNFKENIRQNQNVKILAEYMQDKRNFEKFSSAVNVLGSKFSGIAITQAIINGNISSKEALDYLFMGFAPAIGIQGSLMGYSGLNQIKDALFNGTIDVGAFISGFRRTIQGTTDLKDMIQKRNVQSASDILEFDLTISHNESYQSETPDRRVQSGQSLNEYIHNMPEIINVSCALQEDKRYSKAEFRAILKYLRERKEAVRLVLGDELFDSLVLTEFSPSHDCSKSGMDYNLSFKKITRSDIETNKEVTIQQMPPEILKDVQSSSSLGSSLSSSSGRSAVGGLPKAVSTKDIDYGQGLKLEDLGITDNLEPWEMEASMGSVIYDLQPIKYDKNGNIYKR